MELTYSNQLDGFDPEKRYRNPEHFDKPEAGVTSVLVIGDWPSVVEAYEAAGVEVAVKEVARVAAGNGGGGGGGGGGGRNGEQEDLIGKLRAESDTIRLLVDGLEMGEVERPEAGELAIRLFDALNNIRLQMVELTGQRDSEAEKSYTLQRQIDDLLAQAAKARLEADETKEAKEVAELKAQLDAVGVTYRTNASKESLEKLVAELPKE